MKEFQSLDVRRPKISNPVQSLNMNYYYVIGGHLSFAEPLIIIYYYQITKFEDEGGKNLGGTN